MMLLPLALLASLIIPYARTWPWEARPGLATWVWRPPPGWAEFGRCRRMPWGTVGAGPQPGVDHGRHDSEVSAHRGLVALVGIPEAAFQGTLLPHDDNLGHHQYDRQEQERPGGAGNQRGPHVAEGSRRGTSGSC